MWKHRASIQACVAAVGWSWSSCPVDVDVDVPVVWPLQVNAAPTAVCHRLNATYLAPANV